MSNPDREEGEPRPIRSLLAFALVNVPTLGLGLGLVASAPAGERLGTVAAWLLGALGLMLVGNFLLLGRAVALACTLRDALLQEIDQQEFLRGVLDHRSDGVITWDDLGRVYSLNEAAVRMLGYFPREVIGRPFTLLLRPGSGSAGADALDPVGRRLLGRVTELDAVRKDGSRLPVTVGVCKLRRDGRALFTAVVHDRTGAEETRKIAEAVRSAKSTLLVNVSHEFRTPLSAILGLAEVLRGTADAAERSLHLDRLTGSAEALLRMVEQVLDFAQIEAGEVTLGRETFSLRRVLSDAVAPSVASARSRGLRLTVEVDPETPDYFLGDPERLRQVVGHLVDNAVKFTGEGEVVVRAHGETPLDASGRPSSAVILEVSDTGAGIPADKLEYVFAAFAQADGSSTRRHGGVGLGLSLVSRLTQLMDGEVSVASCESRGTTVRVRLPLSAALGPPALTERPPVLVVHSDGQRAGIIESQLRAGGWPVRHVQSGGEALLELVRGVVQGRPYRLLVVEQALPDGSSPEILAQQMRVAPGGFTLLLADMPPTDDLPTGAHAVLPTNFQPDQLRAVLERFTPSSSIEVAR